MKDKFFTATGAVPNSELVGNFELDKLSFELDLALARDIKNIVIESSKGKLNAGCSRDLVVYIELLEKLKKLRQSTLASLTPEQLKTIAEQK